MHTLVKLVRPFERSQAAPPAEHQAHLGPAHRKPAQRLTAHLSKTVLGLGLVTVGFVFPFQRMLATSSVEAVVKVLFDKVTKDSVKELQPRWIDRLAGVDVWLESHVRTALIYVRWDD